MTGSFGWQAREIRRFHPSVERVIVADLEDVVKVGSSLPENISAGIEYVAGGPEFHLKIT